MGITEQAMIKLTGKDDWGTPINVYHYIEKEYVKKQFQLDACASDYNFKHQNYYSKKDNMFSKQLDCTTFMNPIYGKKGWKTDKKTNQKTFNEYGTGDFIEFAHKQHFKHDSTIAILVFSNVSSSDYFQKYVGATPEIRKRNECEVFFYPKRISFLDSNKKTVGMPSLASMVIVYDKRFGKNYGIKSKK